MFETGGSFGVWVFFFHFCGDSKTYILGCRVRFLKVCLFILFAVLLDFTVALHSWVS